jgi:hypothetical protein
MNEELKKELLEEIRKPAVRVPMKKIKRKRPEKHLVQGELTRRNLKKLETDDFFTHEI